MNSRAKKNQHQEQSATPKSFPAGKEGPTETDSFSDAVVVGREFVRRRANSVTEDVHAGVVLSKGFQAAGGDKKKEQQIVAQLVEAKALSSKQKELPLRSSHTTVSMYTKLALYADVILDPKILPMVPTGYTVLYQLVQLYEDLEGAGIPDAIDRLADILKSSDGPPTKNFLDKQRDKLLAPPPADDPAAPHSLDSPAAANPEELTESPYTTQTVGHQESGALFSTLVVEPNEEDMAKLVKSSYPNRPPVCLNLADRRADDALLLVHASLKEIFRIEDKLSCWGFSRFEHVFSLERPQSPDLADLEVLALAKTGKPAFTPPADWPAVADAWAAIDELIRNVPGHKIHLFAQAQRDGWETIIGASNWEDR